MTAFSATPGAGRGIIADGSGKIALGWFDPAILVSALSGVDAVLNKVTASTTGGLLVEAANGTDVALFGAGNTANATIYGALNVDGGQVQSRQDATQDAIRLLGRAGGSSTRVGTLTTAALGADRTYTFPDADGNVALDSTANIFTQNQSLGTTLESYGASYRVIGRGDVGAIAFGDFTASNKQCFFAVGAYDSGVASFRRVSGSVAPMLARITSVGVSSEYQWTYDAAAGAAGDIFTPTVRMRLTPNGLGIGSPLVGSERLLVSGGNAATSGATQITAGAGVLDFGTSVRYRGTKLLGAQGAAVADATDAASVILRLNDLLARLRAHGIIAT